jgi:hypothetical protein
VRACFDGTTLDIYNNLDVALGVAFTGSVGSPTRTESNFDLASISTRRVSRDSDLLLPGDELKFPIGSGAARVKLRGTPKIGFYAEAHAFQTYIPGKTAGLTQAFTGMMSEVDQDARQYADCEASKSRIHRVGCKPLLVRNIGFAGSRFVIHGALSVARRLLGKALSVITGTIEFLQWAYHQPQQVKAILHSSTISLSAAAPPPTPSPPPPAPPPVAVTVPATGPTLVYDAETAMGSQQGDLEFNEWSAATGESADVSSSLPASLLSYRCVVLLANRSLGATETGLLGTYIRSGGTIVAVGEHQAPSFNEADDTLNTYAGTLDAELVLNEDEVDEGEQTTTYIDPSSLTAGVSTLGDNWASTISASGTAQPLVESSDGSATIVAAQSVGSGQFVMAGDSNMFSDNTFGAYINHDNGQFVRDLCP